MIIRHIPSRLSAGAMVLAAISATYGQGDPVTPTEKTAAKAATTEATTPSKSALRFEGSELHIGSLPPITFHGFLSQGFLYSTSYNYLGEDTKDGSFKFFEAGLNASMNPLPHTRIAAQGFAFDLGNVGEYDPMLDYALVEYTFNDMIGIRGGRIRRPQGIYNHIVDLDVARTSVLLPQGIYDARQRDFLSSLDGAELFGSFSLRQAGSVSYDLYGGVINYAKNGGVARWVASALPLPPTGRVLDLNPNMPVTGAQVWWNTPVNGLRAGASGGVILGDGYDFAINPPYGPGKIHSEGDLYFQCYSLEYLWKAWAFQAEYYRYNFSNPWTVGQTVVRDSHVNQQAWYASAAYRVNKWLEVGTYYSENYQDSSSYPGNSDGFQKDLALSVRFDPTSWWTLKVEPHYIHGTSLLQDNHANPDRHSNGWFLLAMKTSFSF